MKVRAYIPGGGQVTAVPDADGFDDLIQAVDHAALLFGQSGILQAAGNILLIRIKPFPDNLVQPDGQVGAALKGRLAMIFSGAIMDDAIAQRCCTAKKLLGANAQGSMLGDHTDSQVILVNLRQQMKVSQMIQRNGHVGHCVIAKFTVHGSPCPVAGLFAEPDRSGLQRRGREDHDESPRLSSIS